MTTYDWLMAFGAIVVIAILVKAFWRANEIVPNPPDDRLPGA